MRSTDFAVVIGKITKNYFWDDFPSRLSGKSILK
jgi:hypothetical protein